MHYKDYVTSIRNYCRRMSTVSINSFALDGKRFMECQPRLGMPDLFIQVINIKRSILENYPSELLHEIFLYLGPLDVQNLIGHSLVGIFAFERMLDRVLLTHDYPEMSFEHYTQLNFKLIVFLLENSDKFVPSGLIFDSYDDFERAEDSFPGFCKRFKTIAQRGICLDSKQLENLSRCGNLVSVDIGRSKPNLSDFRVPETLKKVRIEEVEIDEELPLVSKLRISSCEKLRTSYLPRTLKSVEFYKIENLIFDTPIPVSVIELKLIICPVKSKIDLSHLVHLKKLTLKGFDWENLRLPPNLTYLELDNCNVLNLEKISLLQKLRELNLSNLHISNCNVFDIKYPNVLERLEIGCSWLHGGSSILPESLHLLVGEYANEIAQIRNDYSPGSIYKESFSNQRSATTFHIALPPKLRHFSFSGGNKIYLSGDITYPPSITTLKFLWLPGVYYSRSQGTSTTLRDCKFPENLETLSLRYCNLREIINTNLGLLKRLKYLDLCGTTLDQRDSCCKSCGVKRMRN